MNDFGGPFSSKKSSYNEGFDIKFKCNNKELEGIKVIQTKLFTKQEYFGNLLK